jgi:hypothetical protein
MSVKPKPTIFTFRYVKSFDFKTVTVNGAHGGVTLAGDINLNFYTDTVELPKLTTHKVSPMGEVLGADVIDPKPEAIREVCFGIKMDITTAKSVALWLNAKIEAAEKQVGLQDPLKKGK